MQLRLLPLTLIAISLAFVAKVSDIAVEIPAIFPFWVADINAQTTEPPPAPPKEPAEKEKPAGDKEESPVEESAKKEVVAGKQEKTYTEEELDVLQHLSQRRQALDAREQDIVMKENVLTATQIRIDKKLEELKALQAKVQALLDTYEDKEDAKLNRLVKIYENMKPKEAALIFERTDLPILMDILVRMPEKKSAPIIAKMDPAYAKEVTTSLALRKRIPE